MIRIGVALLGPVLILAGGCASSSGVTELTEQQVCLEHFKNDPVERDRCLQSPGTRTGSPPEMRPQDLPVRTGEPRR